MPQNRCTMALRSHWNPTTGQPCSAKEEGVGQAGGWIAGLKSNGRRSMLKGSVTGRRRRR